MLRTDELDYKLPPGMIATEPVSPRDAARLMVVHDRGAGAVEHHRVSELPELLRAGDPSLVLYEEFQCWFKIARLLDRPGLQHHVAIPDAEHVLVVVLLPSLLPGPFDPPQDPLR